MVDLSIVFCKRLPEGIFPLRRAPGISQHLPGAAAFGADWAEGGLVECQECGPPGRGAPVHSPKLEFQWIGSRENLQETRVIFP